MRRACRTGGNLPPSTTLRASAALLTCGTTMPCAPQSRVRYISPWKLALMRTTGDIPQRSHARVRLPKSDASTPACSPSSHTPAMSLAAAIGPKASMSSGFDNPPTTVATSPAASFCLARLGRSCMGCVAFLGYVAIFGAACADWADATMRF